MPSKPEGRFKAKMTPVYVTAATKARLEEVKAELEEDEERQVTNTELIGWLTPGAETYRRLDSIRRGLERDRGRKVSHAELMGDLAAAWEMLAKSVAE
jgi:hypothetical protein